MSALNQKELLVIQKIRGERLLNRKTKEEFLYTFLICIFMALAAIVTLYPFVNVIATSFSSSRAIMSGEVSWRPVEFTLDSYRQLIADGQITYSFGNSVVITLAGTFLSIIFTILCAYPLSRKRMIFRGFFIKMVTITMVFSGGLIPNFILIRQLGIMNTYWALWLPNLVVVFNMLILKSQFENIPDSLEEAAAIDGATDFYILIRIMLPVSMSTIATIILFYAVANWNSYMNVIMFITNSKKYNMAAKLMQMINQSNEALLTGMSGENPSAQRITPEGLKATSIVFSTVPILLVYPFLQKYFVSGVMIGSIKG